MKSQKQINKRAFSPLLTKNVDIHDSKKKSTSNYPINLYHYKQFDTHTKTDKKKQSNYLKDLIKQPDSNNKYRIVTEPVDDRVLTLVSSSFAHHHRSKGKIQYEKSNSRVRNVSNDKNQKKVNPECCNCKKHLQQLNTVKIQLNKLLSGKMLWKNGQIQLKIFKQQLGLSSLSPNKQKHISYTSLIKPTDSILFQIKRHFYDLMKDIESLSQIDYPKMLNLNIFKYEPEYKDDYLNQGREIKSLLGQLRNQYEGKLSDWDMQSQSEENEHTKAIFRNMKARLSNYMRQNLQLKLKEAILSRSEEISSQSQEYLRKIIEDVLATYALKQ